MTATPGPWRAVNRSVDGADDPSLGWDIEGPPSAERGMFQNRADAQLAAAAPDLLQMVDALADAICTVGALVPEETYQLALKGSALVAKTEGHQP